LDQYLKDDFNWVERSNYWAIKSQEIPFNYRRKRRDRRPLIICGHGARLNIDRGTLFIRNGFTHYPQKREEFRYFRGDPHLPSRIIIIDASGSISFHALAWLNEQEIPLIQLNWQGEIICIANANYAANAKLVIAQHKALLNGKAKREFQNLIIQKFRNSIITLKILPDKMEKITAISVLQAAIKELSLGKSFSTEKMLGIEGRAAALYFAAWRGLPIKWKLSRREFIPNDWNIVSGGRRSLGKSNRNARHPINAILNYAYAILHAQVKMQIIAEGLDPTIGISHSTEKYRDALVLDGMEPLSVRSRMKEVE
jgi:CRISPR-associated protein Cas1